MGSFIESKDFPASKIDEASREEKHSPHKPKHWEMVNWPGRKPLISARALIAGVLLPDNFSEEPLRDFLSLIRLDCSSNRPAHERNLRIDKWREVFKNVE